MGKSSTQVGIIFMIHSCMVLGFKPDDVEKFIKNGDCRGCDLSNARILHHYAAWSHLEEANLSHANLTGSNLQLSYMHKANLSGADLTGTDLAGTDLSDADLSEADLTLANLNATIVTGTNICNVKGISETKLHELYARGAVCKPKIHERSHLKKHKDL